MKIKLNKENAEKLGLIEGQSIQIQERNSIDDLKKAFVNAYNRHSQGIQITLDEVEITYQTDEFEEGHIINLYRGLSTDISLILDKNVIGISSNKITISGGVTSDIKQSNITEVTFFNYEGKRVISQLVDRNSSSIIDTLNRI